VLEADFCERRRDMICAGTDVLYGIGMSLCRPYAWTNGLIGGVTVIIDIRLLCNVNLVIHHKSTKLASISQQT
jgi:hypothetical protein